MDTDTSWRLDGMTSKNLTSVRSACIRRSFYSFVFKLNRYRIQFATIPAVMQSYVMVCVGGLACRVLMFRKSRSPQTVHDL